MINTLTEYTARNTMALKEENSCLSFVSTIWRNSPVLVVFDNLNNKIISTYFEPAYQEGDIGLLEKIIEEFLN